MVIKNRLPSLDTTLGVYGIIVLMVYGWTAYWFFWKLPSWLFFETAGDIFTNLAYTLSTNFLESLCVLVLPLAASLILPLKWFKDVFSARGAALVTFGLLYAMYFAKQVGDAGDNYPSQLVHFVPVVALGIVILVFLVGRIGLLRRIFEGLAERAIIFAYIGLPISMICLIIVVIRNIF